MHMSSLQKALAIVRELRYEELDIVGGAASWEPDYCLVYCTKTVATEHGNVYVTVPDGGTVCAMNPD
jgi:hypothetical protein